MSIVQWTACWDAPTAPLPKLILMSLADHANDDGTCYPSIARMSRKTGMAERSVTRMIAILEKDGHLTAERRTGKSTFYRLHPRLTVTPDSQSPLTHSHHTPDCQSGDPRLAVTTPLTASHPNLKEPSKNRKEASVDANLTLSDLVTAGIQKQVAKDWLEVRKGKRAGPLTQTAWNGLQREALAAGVDVAFAVGFCVERSWVSFNAGWYGKSAGVRTMTPLARHKTVIDEFVSLGVVHETD